MLLAVEASSLIGNRPIQMADLSCQWRIQLTRHLFSTSTKTHLYLWCVLFGPMDRVINVDGKKAFPLHIECLIWNYLNYPSCDPLSFSW
jgi:hypothetical protein